MSPIECLPVLLGAVIGSIFRVAFGAERRSLLWAAVLVAGVLSTLASGEWRVSWMYAAVDVVLTLAGAVAASVMIPRLQARKAALHV